MTPDDYQQAARELARIASMPEQSAVRMERDLERAFDGASAAYPAPARRPYAALAAAAAVVMALGAGAWSMRQRGVTPNDPARADRSVRLQADPARVDRTVRLQADPAPADRRVRLRPHRAPAKNLPPVVQPAGFVPVPSAARLPQFESGVIVRLSLPVAALPSYGVDISPASSGDAVEADVLVAQDGVARAIRLVNPTRSQQ